MLDVSKTSVEMAVVSTVWPVEKVVELVVMVEMFDFADSPMLL